MKSLRFHILMLQLVSSSRNSRENFVGFLRNCGKLFGGTHCAMLQFFGRYYKDCF